MGGVKRKDAPVKANNGVKKQKILEEKKSRLDQAAGEDFEGFSDEEKGAATNGHKEKKKQPYDTQSSQHNDAKAFKLETSSAEAHAKQRALAKERKAAKPNADIIQRSKKIWERLRRKSHVPKEERKELVTELFSLIAGRVRDFVFKHDSVRVIQCALKYSNGEQRRTIVDELKDDIRVLAESRYGKFLVAKMVVEGDQEIRNIIVPRFYGHVQRLINHPEASWIVDDIYRQIATPLQKAMMLREWYGTEFAIFNRESQNETADLTQILEKNPEKRKPILEHLKRMLNGLIQKKMTGFTMLHDAMLQYFLALTPGSEEHGEFLELLRDDIDTETEGGGGDLFRNLAFTKCGSRLVCLALAHGSAKDRKIILRCFRDNVELMAYDKHAKMVLVTGLEVPDDTKMSGKAILGELLGQSQEADEQRLDRLENLVINTAARLPILFPLAGPASWLVNEQEKTLLDEIYAIRSSTSKKDPALRRQGLLEQLSPPLLELVASRASSLVQSSFGCQLITETFFSCSGAGQDNAKSAVAELAQGDPLDEGHISQSPPAGRLLKALVSGGPFDLSTKTTKIVEPRLNFAATVWPFIQDHIVAWACSRSSFVVVGLLESVDVGEQIKTTTRKALVKGKKQIEAAAEGGSERSLDSKLANGKPDGGSKGNAGARILLSKLE